MAVVKAQLASEVTRKSGGVIAQPVIRRPPEPNTGTLLLYAYKRFDRQLFASLHKAGYRDLRSKHGAVLANIDTRGTRPTTLAERAEIGTSAMGELLDELERLGYIERTPHPRDRRAKLVLPTSRGVDALKVAVRTIRDIEAAYARRLGRSGHAALREALSRIADAAPRDGRAEKGAGKR